MVPSDAVTAVLCSRVSDVVIIVASAFKNLSNHENTLDGVLVHKKESMCYYRGRPGQKASKQAFVNNYSIDSTCAWKARIFLSKSPMKDYLNVLL